MEDRELIRRIHRGQKQYLNEIAEKYYDDIYRFCCYQTGNRQESYDLAQEMQVWCIRMIVFGCMDFLILSVMIEKIAAQFSMDLVVIGVYLLVPFVAANVGYLLIFS